MEKPKIVAVSEKKAVDGRPGSLPVARQQRELTDLEKSVAEEMRKRGEQVEIDGEEQAPETVNATLEARVAEANPTPAVEATAPQTAPPISTPATPSTPVPPAAIEVAAEAAQLQQQQLNTPATPPAKPRIVQRVWPAATEELMRKKRAEEARSFTPTPLAPEPERELTREEKMAAAENAQKVYAEKQAQSSMLAKLKRLLRLA